MPSIAILLAVTFAPGLAVATPILSASAGNSFSNAIGNCNPPGGSGASSAAISFHVVCADSNGTVSATGSADIGHVGAKASTVGFSPFSNIGNAGGGGSYLDTVVFTAADASVFPNGIPVSLNLLFSGTLNSSPGGGVDISASVSIAGSTVASYRDANANGVELTCTSSFVGGAGCGSVAFGAVTTGTVTVPLNFPVQFFLTLGIDAGSAGTGSANGDFSHSLDLPTGIDVFNLPHGVTANAPDSFIADNRFAPPGSATVPEPSALLMLAFGLGGLAWTRQWRRGGEVIAAQP